MFNVQASMAAETDSVPGPKTGTVAETMDSGGYSYLRLEEQGIWIATASLPVAVGDKVQYTGGAEMRNFVSKSLDRTFESIFFIQNVSIESKDIDVLHAAAQGHESKGMPIPKPAAVEAPAAGEITRLTKAKPLLIFLQNQPS